MNLQLGNSIVERDCVRTARQLRQITTECDRTVARYDVAVLIHVRLSNLTINVRRIAESGYGRVADDGYFASRIYVLSTYCRL